MHPARNIINVYCDESCHLEGDMTSAMVLGSIACPAAYTSEISKRIREIKDRYGLSPKLEVKWTKVSPARTDLYLELVELFLSDPRLSFRGLVVPDKTVLDHGRFAQSHDDWYYKMYYTLLSPIFSRRFEYRIYIDIKDTRGVEKQRKLHEVLCNKLRDFNGQCVTRVQQIRSHESELLQLADLIIGAISYANRGLSSSSAKLAIIDYLRAQLGQNSLTSTSLLAEKKLNLLVWKPRKALV